MTIDPDKLLALEFPDVPQSYGWRDCALYALGLGLGIDSLDERQLPFVTEKSPGALPTMANVLCYPGFWMRDLPTGIDWVKVVHGEQSMRIHRPIPTEGRLVGRTRVIDIVDKGVGKGALVYAERKIADTRSGEPVATLLQTVFCRGDGGFGGKTEVTRKPHPVPQRPADTSIALPTHSQLALIYRLSGDLNPLHSDPASARKAGFERPILHGLATYGIAGHGLLALLCDYDPKRLVAMKGRFSAPVFPGDTLRVDVWREAPGEAAFEVVVPARNATVFTNGHCEFLEFSGA